MTPAIATLRNLGKRALERSGIARAIGTFGHNDKGATAVEFSLVALPFFALMFAILETALAFFAQNYFEDTLAGVARQVRTGQAQQSNLTSDGFKTLLCAKLAPLFNCPGGVTLDIRSYTSFADVNTNGLGIPLIPVGQPGAGNLDTTNTLFAPGNGGDIIRVRAYYSWPVFVNRLGNNLVSTPDGTHLLVATAAFRNEPFPW